MMLNYEKMLEEYYSKDTGELEEGEFLFEREEEEDEDTLFIGGLLLGLLQNFYHRFEGRQPDYIERQLPDALDVLEQDMIRIGGSELKDYSRSVKEYILSEDGILPNIYDKVGMKLVDVKGTLTTFNQGIRATLSEIKQDVLTKIRVHKDGNQLPQQFNLKSNFRRAIKKIKNTVRYNVKSIAEKTKRSFDEWKFKDNLFIWTPSWKNTCDWCIALWKEGAKPIEYFPFDHIHGGCTLVNATGELSKEYKYLMGGL